MTEQEVNYQETIKKFDKKLPKFVMEGESVERIDYHGVKEAPVLICFVKYKDSNSTEDKILLLKRSDNVMVYKGQWNTVAGFLDQADKSLEEKVWEELGEEIGITKEQVTNLKKGEAYKVYDKEVNINWIIFPVRIELKTKPKIKLDREHTDFKWINPQEISNHKTIFGLEKSLKKVL